jgi:hypothetical protein
MSANHRNQPGFASPEPPNTGPFGRFGSDSVDFPVATPVRSAGGSADSSAAGRLLGGQLRFLRQTPSGPSVGGPSLPDWLFPGETGGAGRPIPSSGWFDSVLPVEMFLAGASGTDLVAGAPSVADHREGAPRHAPAAGGLGSSSASASSCDVGSHDDSPRAPSRTPGSQPDPLLGQTLGQFKLLSRLGSGAKGVVYEAEDVLLGRRVAVKVLAAELLSRGRSALKRFMLEARIASRLDHRNCVTVYAVGKHEGLLFFAMTLVRGMSAQDFLERKGPLDPVLATRIVESAARGLSAAHAIGVVHRDIKPANILLGHDGSIKLADFGIAKAADEAIGELTEPGRWMGTPQYMSPEQCRGEPADFRSDIYGLGATWYCMLTGRPPFSEANPRGVMYKQVFEPHPDPRLFRPELAESCVRLLNRCLSKDPAERPQTALEFADQLRSVRKDFTVRRAAPPATPAPSVEASQD